MGCELSPPVTFSSRLALDLCSWVARNGRTCQIYPRKRKKMMLMWMCSWRRGAPFQQVVRLVSQKDTSIAKKEVEKAEKQWDSVIKTTALWERSNPHSDLQSQDPRNEEPGKPAATVNERESEWNFLRVCCRPKMSPDLGCSPSGSDCDGGIGRTIQEPLTPNYPLLAGPGVKSPDLKATIKYTFPEKNFFTKYLSLSTIY